MRVKQFYSYGFQHSVAIQGPGALWAISIRKAKRFVTATTPAYFELYKMKKKHCSICNVKGVIQSAKCEVVTTINWESDKKQ